MHRQNKLRILRSFRQTETYPGGKQLFYNVCHCQTGSLKDMFYILEWLAGLRLHTIRHHTRSRINRKLTRDKYHSISFNSLTVRPDSSRCLLTANYFFILFDSLIINIYSKVSILKMLKASIKNTLRWTKIRKIWKSYAVFGKQTHLYIWIHKEPDITLTQ